MRTPSWAAALLPVLLLAGAAGGSASAGPGPGTAVGASDGAPAGAVADTVTCDGDTAGAAAAGDAPTAVPGEAARERPSGAAPPDGAELMRKAASVYDTLRTLRARFRQTIEMRVFEPPRRREGTGTWYQRRPSRFRMDFSDPEEDLIVSDGRHLWLYYPSTHPGQVIRSELGAGGRGAAMVDLQGRIFELARTRYDVRYAGRDTLDGAPVHRVELEPRAREAAYRRVGVWLDAGSLLVRRLVFEDRSETVRTVTLHDVRTGMSLADSLFRFRVPEGAEVFEG